MGITATDVQSVGAEGGNEGAAVSVAFGADNQAGNAILATLSYQATFDPGFPVVHDTQGNSYALLGKCNTGGSGNRFQMYVWMAYNCKAGANTVTNDNGVISSNYLGLEAIEWNGIGLAADGFVDATAGTPTGSIVTANPKDLVLAISGSGGGLGGPSQP